MKTVWQGLLWKGLGWTGLFLFFAVFFIASFWLPPRGDTDAPMHREISPAGSPVAGTYYIRNALSDADTPNIVTVVLADYRGFDTMGEVIVVFTAGISIFLIMRRLR